MRKFFRILTITICFLMVSALTYATDMYDAKIIMNYDPTIANSAISNEITVQLNGEYIDFTDSEGNKVDPQIINDRTMVPMRKIFEVFGANVEWFPEDRSIKATTADLEIGLQIDNEKATVKTISGDSKEITLDSVPTIIDGRTLVPVRFIAESLDKKVGWDADNRSVIIIDTSFIEEKIKEAAPNFYEYIMLDLEELTSYEMTAEISGKVKYEDKEDKSNNTSLNLVGDVDVKSSNDLMKIDLDLSITGKGVLIETVKEEGLDKIEASFIIDMKNFDIYMSFEEELVGKIYADKWIKYTLVESDKEILATYFETSKDKDTIDALVDSLLGEELTVASYDSLDLITDIICSLVGDDKFKVSGRTSKKYEYEIELDDIIEIIGLTDEERKEIEDYCEMVITSSEKITNGVANESVAKILLDIDTDVESLSIELEVESELGSYNENVKVEMPDEKEIVEL